LYKINLFIIYTHILKFLLLIFIILPFSLVLTHYANTCQSLNMLAPLSRFFDYDIHVITYVIRYIIQHLSTLTVIWTIKSRYERKIKAHLMWFLRVTESPYSWWLNIHELLFCSMNRFAALALDEDKCRTLKYSNRCYIGWFWAIYSF
jgi:hypothetical protein